MTRTLLVDDERCFLEPTATFMRGAGFLCDCASDAAEAIDALGREVYDVLITDLQMAGNASLEFIELVATTREELPVVIVTGHPSLSSAIRALKLNVADYVLKPVEPQDLIDAVERAATAGRHRRRIQSIGGKLSALARELVVEGDPTDPAAEMDALPLSSRERTVADGIARGIRVEVLALTLGISERTVRNHLQSCYRKLGVHSQIELAARLRHRPG